MMHDYVFDERRGPVKTFSLFAADAHEQKLLVERRGRQMILCYNAATHEAEMEKKTIQL